VVFFFSSRRRHTRSKRDWSSDVCSSDLYHKNSNMWEYTRKTRIPVDDIFELLEREDRGVDKVQALFADMEERRAAWKELEAEPRSEERRVGKEWRHRRWRAQERRSYKEY